jgi:hypothetical protein
MKNFKIQIRWKGYYANFTLRAEDSKEGIEQSILDKLGKNEVKFEKDGFTIKEGRWITYEEVINDPRPIHYKEVLGVRMATRTPESGQA